MPAAEFKARFTEFANMIDAVVDAALSEASRFVTADRWPEADRELATWLLAAHFLYIEKRASVGAAQLVESVRSISYGPMSIAFANQGTQSNRLGNQDIESPYLQRFRMLRSHPESPIVLDGSTLGGV